jgi:hypothetical protein
MIWGILSAYLPFFFIREKKRKFNFFFPSSFELIKGLLLLLLLLLMVVLLLKNKTLLSDVKIFGCFFQLNLSCSPIKTPQKYKRRNTEKRKERKKSRWHFARGFLPKRRFLIPTKMKGNLQITYLAQMEPSFFSKIF